MIDETISSMEERVRGAEGLQPERRRELLSLLGTLKCEVARLSETEDEHARSIAGFVGVSTHEAVRSQRDPHLLQLSLDGLSSSVDGFEASHPKLVESVNAFCLMLSNLGI